MGMIKRILKQTSQKLLNQLGGHHRGSHQLVSSLVVPGSLSPTQQAHLQGANKLRSRSRASRKLRLNSNKTKTAAIPEALLLAAKNYLPPVQFHHVHGPNAQLSKNKFVARRTQSFCQALVFSNRVILPNERVYIKVLDIAKGWSGTIRFGFTSVDPATLLYQMPKHACPDMTNAGHTWARALADEVVRRNSVIHFSYNTNGYIHYGINNQDCGIFYANVNTSQHLWFVVDIYGLTAAVELIDPRAHNGNSSEFQADFSRNSRAPSADNDGRSTMYKSLTAAAAATTTTTTMDNFVPDVGPNGRSIGGGKKKKRSSRSNGIRNYSYELWPPEIVFMNHPPNNLAYAATGLQSQQRPLLPNLNSIILPQTQQNIYSPMPSMVARANQPPAAPTVAANESAHDYYHIMTQNQQQQQQHQSSQLRAPSNHISKSTANLSLMSAGSSSAVANSSSILATTASNNSPTTQSANPLADGRQRRRPVTDEHEICQQLESFQISASSQGGQRQCSSSSTNSPSAASRPGRLVNGVPVASARSRGQQINSSANQIDAPTTRRDKSSSSSATPINKKANAKSQSPVKGRQSTKATKASLAAAPTVTVATSSRDNNNNSPPSKDCPICFERPINCVLYQCGHMCTCYECGVKQWKTQSRTCPICRTIIKDVIKTYMS